MPMYRTIHFPSLLYSLINSWLQFTKQFWQIFSKNSTHFWLESEPEAQENHDEKFRSSCSHSIFLPICSSTHGRKVFWGTSHGKNFAPHGKIQDNSKIGELEHYTYACTTRQNEKFPAQPLLLSSPQISNLYHHYLPF